MWACDKTTASTSSTRSGSERLRSFDSWRCPWNRPQSRSTVACEVLRRCLDPVTVWAPPIISSSIMYAAFARTMPVALPDADGELQKFFAVATTAPQGLRAGAPPDGLTVWHGTRTCRRHREDPMLQCPAC